MPETSSALPQNTLLNSGLATYRIVRVLGQDGFGITYLAETSIKVGNLTHKVNVAIKECYQSQTCWRGDDGLTVACSKSVNDQIDTSKRDFIAEARRLQSLGASHPNIVKVNEVFEANNTAYYVMEFLPGMNLTQYVKGTMAHRLDESQMWNIMRPVIEAIDFLHKNSITHLDIKPDNILISVDSAGNPEPVLIDFGLAKHYDKDGRPTSTIGVLGLTPGYSPIEQYGGIGEFSPTSDLYALAATILFCLSGKDPLEATRITPEDIDAQIPADVSDATRRALHTSLAPFAKDRPKSVQPLLDACAAFYTPVATVPTEKIDLPAPHSVSPTPVPSPVWPTPAAPESGTVSIDPVKGSRRPSLNTWLTIMLAAVVVVSFGLWGLLGGFTYSNTIEQIPGLPDGWEKREVKSLFGTKRYLRSPMLVAYKYTELRVDTISDYALLTDPDGKTGLLICQELGEGFWALPPNFDVIEPITDSDAWGSMFLASQSQLWGILSDQEEVLVPMDYGSISLDDLKAGKATVSATLPDGTPTTIDMSVWMAPAEEAAEEVPAEEVVEAPAAVETPAPKMVSDRKPLDTLGEKGEDKSAASPSEPVALSKPKSQNRKKRREIAGVEPVIVIAREDTFEEFLKANHISEKEFYIDNPNVKSYVKGGKYVVDFRTVFK